VLFVDPTGLLDEVKKRAVVNFFELRKGHIHCVGA